MQGSQYNNVFEQLNFEQYNRTMYIKLHIF
jgi:hypothetical protein